MPFEPAVQRAAREAEGLRRVTHIAAGARERFLDQDALDFLQAHLIERTGTIAATTETEIARADRARFRQQDRALDRMIQLADVAGPSVAQQQLHRIGPEHRVRLVVTGRVETEKVRGEQRDVLTPIAQGGEPDFHGVEPEQQILTESCGLYLRMKV